MNDQPLFPSLPLLFFHFILSLIRHVFIEEYFGNTCYIFKSAQIHRRVEYRKKIGEAMFAFMSLWVIAAFIAYFIKGLCGFANTLVFTSILSFGVANAKISPVDLLLGFPANIIMTWRNRKSLDRKIWLPLAIFVVAGSIPGALLLKNVDVSFIKILFGIVVALLGIEMLVREYRKTNAGSSKILMVLISIAAGMLCGLFGVGALLAAYVSRTAKSDSAFKANTSAVFIVDNFFRIILYTSLGLLTPETIQMVIVLIPFSLLGLFAGMKCCKYINEKIIRRSTTILLMVSGISLALANI